MLLSDAVTFLKKRVPNPSKGLPDEVFYYVSETTPLVNVDLLIKDENGRTLLAWRDDQYAGQGWHVPGGIVRFKETLEARIQKVAETEIGIAVAFEPVPIALNQLIHKERDVRGHFISILYKCFLSQNFIPKNEGLSCNNAGFLKWHRNCPVNLLKCLEIYRKYIEPPAFHEVL
jgi:ADP-ribose pyrophosphatase YjhB (NUDIX family)